MLFIDFFCQEFVLILLVLGTAILVGLSNDDTLRKTILHVTLFAVLFLTVADYLESYYADLPYWNYERVFYSFIGYSLRPVAALGLVGISRFKTKYYKLLYIPAVVNCLIYSTALFTNNKDICKLAFSFDIENTFSRGPLGYFAHGVGIFYIVVIMIYTLSTIKSEYLGEGLVVLLCGISSGLAMIIETEVDGNILNEVIAVSILFYVFYRNVIRSNAYQMAVASSKAKSNFLFNMSHDIRTPMNAIKGFSELALKNQGNPEKERDCIQKIQISCDQLMDIINNTLEMARIENGKVTIQEELVDLNEIKNMIDTVFRPVAEEKHILYVVDWKVQHPYLYLDRSHVNQILMNLVSNSMKYTPEGENIFVRFTTKNADKDGKVILEIVVKDTGIGMSKEFLGHAYDSFSRERTSTNSGVAGTGLGLGIVKNLVDLMGGSIHLDSEVHIGTTATVCIPVRVGEENELVKEVLEDQVDADIFKGKRVLLAEDNELNAEIVVDLLKEYGFEVEQANDGVICVDMYKDHPEGYYDLILMDIQMPNMDGYEATKCIRKIHSKTYIPIIALSANAFQEDRMKSLEAGMDAHEAKPIHVASLMRTLRKFLQER